jgi:hypothetical protein
MSIASRIESIENHIEEAYTEISRLGVDLTNVNKNIDNIADTLQEAYSQIPKVTDTGSNVSLSNTRVGGLSITPLGACEQDSENIVVNNWESGSIDNNNGQDYVNPETVRTIGYIPVTPNTFYNITRTIYTSYMNLRFYDSAKNYLGTQNTVGMVTTNKSNNRMEENESSMTMAINNTSVAYMRIADHITNTSLVYNIVSSVTPDYPQNIRVVTGDNEVVVQNKNLLNTSTIQNVKNESGQSRQGFYYVAQKNEDYTIDFNYSEKNYYYRAVDNVISNIALTDTYYSSATKTHTFTLQKGQTIVAWQTTANANEKILLVKGSALPSEFIAHAEQTYTLHLGTNYLAGIGDYKDQIVGYTDNWKIRRNTKTRTYNGTESWGYNSPNRCFYLAQSDYLTTGFVPYANYFIGQNVSYLAALTNKHISYCSNNVNQLLVKYLDIEQTATAFKTWLSTHNLIAYYILKTPTEETITDTTLINDLNNMYQAMGYDGTTNITITSNPNNAQMTASVSALKGE